MKFVLITLTQLLFTLFMYVMGSIFFGASLVPGLAILFKVWSATVHLHPLLRLFLVGTSIALAYFFIWHNAYSFSWTFSNDI